jgi:hypothetical protein
MKNRNVQEGVLEEKSRFLEILCIVGVAIALLAFGVTKIGSSKSVDLRRSVATTTCIPSLQVSIPSFWGQEFQGFLGHDNLESCFASKVPQPPHSCKVSSCAMCF